MSIYNTVINGIAKTVAIISPKAARSYLGQHIALRGYDAGKTTGINRNPRSRQTSGAQDVQESWQVVANRARELANNNSYVAGMTRRFIANLIGEGSWPRPKILKKGATSEYDFETELNKDILARWEVWADEACANGDTVYQLQRMAARAFFIDGGFLIRKVIVKGQLRLEPIEIDRLDTSKDTDTSRLRIVGGKELDEFNKPIAYWIKSRFPSEQETQSTRIKAEDIIDLYDRERASSTGGISALAPCVMNFYNIGQFRKDTMSLARTALGFGVFVKTENPEDYFGGSDLDEQGHEYEYITPGGIHYLRPGEEINTVKPEAPTTQYEPFLRAELRGASVGAGMSYESVSNDGSQTNFSGTRQMLLFERAATRYTFAIFEEKLYSKIYRWFIEFEQSFGVKPLRMNGYDTEPKRFLRCSWSRPKVEWVDPLKDAKAAKEEIAMGVSTLTEFCETQGRDIEEVVATRKYEKELFEAAGVESDLSQNRRVTSEAKPNTSEE